MELIILLRVQTLLLYKGNEVKIVKFKHRKHHKIVDNK